MGARSRITFDFCGVWNATARGRIAVLNAARRKDMLQMSAEICSSRRAW